MKNKRSVSRFKSTPLFWLTLIPLFPPQTVFALNHLVSLSYLVWSDGLSLKIPLINVSYLLPSTPFVCLFRFFFPNNNCCTTPFHSQKHWQSYPELIKVWPVVWSYFSSSASAWWDPTHRTASSCGAPSIKIYMDLLENIESRATNLIRGLRHLSWKERLTELGVFSLERGPGRPHWHLSILEENL